MHAALLILAGGADRSVRHALKACAMHQQWLHHMSGATHEAGAFVRAGTFFRVVRRAAEAAAARDHQKSGKCFCAAREATHMGSGQRRPDGMQLVHVAHAHHTGLEAHPSSQSHPWHEKQDPGRSGHSWAHDHLSPAALVSPRTVGGWTGWPRRKSAVAAIADTQA